MTIPGVHQSEPRRLLRPSHIAAILSVRLCPPIRAASTTAAKAKYHSRRSNSVSTNQSRVDYCGATVRSMVAQQQRVHQSEPRRLLRQSGRALGQRIPPVSTNQSRVDYCGLRAFLWRCANAPCVHQSEPRRLLRPLFVCCVVEGLEVSTNQSRVDYCGTRSERLKKLASYCVHQSEPRRLLRQTTKTRTKMNSTCPPIRAASTTAAVCGRLVRVDDAGVHQSEPRRLLRQCRGGNSGIDFVCPPIRAASTTAAR